MGFCSKWYCGSVVDYAFVFMKCDMREKGEEREVGVGGGKEFEWRRSVPKTRQDGRAPARCIFALKIAPRDPGPSDGKQSRRNRELGWLGIQRHNGMVVIR